MEPSFMRDKPVLAEILDLDRWQRIQNHFSQVLGIPMRSFTAQRELLVRPSWPELFPMDEAIAYLRIGDELDALIPQGGLVEQTTSLTTALDVTFSVIPLRAQQVMAYILLGPMVLGPRSPQDIFCARMEEMGLDSKRLWSLLLNLKCYSYASIYAAFNLIRDVGESMLEHAIAGRAAQKPARTPEDELLQSLLETAQMATQADGGSIMVLDQETGAMSIRAAAGLSPEVVQQTRIRPGEGIAGWVVEQDKICLLDRGQPHILASHMQRSDVASSLVAPLKRDAGEPFGVLSLRVQDEQRRFTDAHVRLLGHLLDLTGLALKGAGSAERTV
jgi:hypothetical protein